MSIDVSEAEFQAEVIERSFQTPVIVDFWAEWCGPCRQLGPLIESAVDARGDEVVLAKVDIDSAPGLAQRYRVSSIPAVKAFVNGEVAEEFVGLVPPPQLEAFINRVLPSQADRLVEEGDEASLREALVREPGHLGATRALGRLLMVEGRHEEAREVLLPATFDHEVDGLLARMDLAAADEPDVVAALAALERDDRAEALRHLVDAVPAASRNRRDRIRAAAVGIFAELGDQHPLTVEFRRRLARAFY